MDTVFASFGYHPVYGIFVQLQDACGGSHSIALGYATDNHLDSLCRVLGAEESRVTCFREPFPASLALQQLSFVFPVGTGLDDVSVISYPVMDTGFVHAKVLIDIEHVLPPLR